MAVEMKNAIQAVNHDRHTYYFCCDGCRRQFLEDPAHFLAAGERAEATAQGQM
jgi:YHS domain-containing protein